MPNMDQLKQYLATAKKQQFWILGGVLLLAAIGVWYWGTGDLDTKFESDRRRNESSFASLTSLKFANGPNQPPNEKYKGEVDKLRGTLEDEVKAAWQNLYNRQKPALPVHPRVGAMAAYLTDEKKIRDEIPPAIRETYHNNLVIEDDFRDLFAILNLRRAAGMNPVDDLQVVGRAQNAANNSASVEGLVVWTATPSPRNLMLRYKTTKTPSTARIRLTQEDLWVFRSMFGVIQRINQRPIDDWLQILDGKEPENGAVDQANVPIKQIEYCDLAQYAMTVAIARPGTIKMLANEGEEEGAAEVGGGGGGGSFTVGTVGNDEEDKKLLEDRYVDGRNGPVKDPKAPPFTEFKQMFVQMNVLMDQRLIPVLIAECSNAPLPIETRQLLVDLTQVDVPRGGVASQGVNKVEQSPHDAKIILRGIVYGYSPPDKSNLGKGSDTEPSKRDYGIPIKVEERLY
jgi:hypothetical protein